MSDYPLVGVQSILHASSAKTLFGYLTKETYRSTKAQAIDDSIWILKLIVANNLY